mmetsp:Transcript_71307/g.126009  ORF Transcript_71307/g.126009 Transcript_71307/m.126009 type:complete len:186 (+) Transcript_71307:53-610(+)
MGGTGAARTSTRSGSRGPSLKVESSDLQELSEVDAQLSAEDKAWELLLDISGAHAQGGPAGRVELRKLATEARRLLAGAPPLDVKEGLGLMAVLHAVFSLVTLAWAILSGVSNLLISAALGQPEPAVTPAPESVPGAEAKKSPKAKSSVKRRARPEPQLAVDDAAEEEASEDEEEEEVSKGCVVS